MPGFSGALLPTVLSGISPLLVLSFGTRRQLVSGANSSSRQLLTPSQLAHLLWGPPGATWLGFDGLDPYSHDLHQALTARFLPVSNARSSCSFCKWWLLELNRNTKRLLSESTLAEFFPRWPWRLPLETSKARVSVGGGQSTGQEPRASPYSGGHGQQRLPSKITLDSVVPLFLHIWLLSWRLRNLVYIWFHVSHSSTCWFWLLFMPHHWKASGRRNQQLPF